jgi:hypothetical protein
MLFPDCAYLQGKVQKRPESGIEAGTLLIELPP